MGTSYRFCCLKFLFLSLYASSTFSFWGPCLHFVVHLSSSKDQFTVPPVPPIPIFYCNLDKPLIANESRRLIQPSRLPLFFTKAIRTQQLLVQFIEAASGVRGEKNCSSNYSRPPINGFSISFGGDDNSFKL